MSQESKSGTPVLAVVGAGSWATAIVKILSESPIRINWWMHSAESVEHVRQFAHNPRYLSDIQIAPAKVFPSSNLDWVLEDAGMVILALPAVYLEGTLKTCRPELLRQKQVFSAIKGMVPGYHLSVSDFLAQHYELRPFQIGIIAGPCHSEEVALERQSYLSISSSNVEAAHTMANVLACRYIHTHVIENDVQGIEYATIMKNVFSLAAGICRGMGYGDNFQAVLVSNAMQEMKRFLDAATPNLRRDMNQSAYLGDLLVTSYSLFSRNRVFGQMLGKGYSVQRAQIEMNMIAEGYYAALSLNEVNKRVQVDLPICDFVYRVLYGNASPSREVRILEALFR